MDLCEQLGFENKPRYFDREGKPLQLLEWARMCEGNEEYRIVKQEMVGEYFVSTVWVGLNMSYWRYAPIKIFETMIFRIDEDMEIEDSIRGYQQRYSTETEALKGHEKAIKIAKGEIENG